MTAWLPGLQRAGLRRVVYFGTARASTLTEIDALFPWPRSPGFPRSQGAQVRRADERPVGRRPPRRL